MSDLRAGTVQELQKEISLLKQRIHELEKSEMQLRLTEEALKKSEELFRKAFHTNQDSININRLSDGLYVSINEGFTRLTGYTEADVIGQSSIELNIWDNLEDRNRLVAGIRKDGEVKNLEAGFRRKDGSLVYGSMSASVIELDGVPHLLNVTRDITFQKQAEEDLRRVTAFMDSIVENIPNMIFVKDAADLRFVRINRAGEELLGYSRKDLLGKSDLDFFPKEQADFFREKDREVLRSGVVVDIREEPIQTLGKGRRILHTKKVPITDAAGNAEYLLGISEDITERRDAEDRLSKSERKYFSTFHLIPNPMAVSGIETGIIIDVNQAFIDWTGCSREELIGASVHDLHLWVNREDRKKVIDMLAATGEVNGVEVLMRKKNGDERSMLFSARIIEIDRENHLLTLAHDITEQKRALGALRESEELYTRLVSTIPDIVIRTDLEGRILFVNDYILEATGYDREEIVGRNLISFIPPEEQSRAVSNLMKVMAGGSQGPTEYHLTMKDGSVVPIEVNGNVLRAGDGTPFGRVHVCRDISQRKQAELEREQLREQLVQSQKIEAVGRLAGGIAHDFNNMLGVILGHLEMAMEQVEPGSPLRTDLQEVWKAAMRSAELTGQLLAFARKQTISPAVLDINETIAGMLKMLQRLIGEDIHIVWLPGVNTWPVKIDPSQIDQILANLCVNARDAITGVGRITIETGNIIFDRAYCEDHTGFVPGEYVLLAVSDDGCGIDKEVLGSIFEPFFTTKEMGKGTGLGLSMVYGIVKQNSGFINIYSEPDKGTSCRIYLPRHASGGEKTVAEEPQKAAAQGWETILVVEDEPAILNLSRIILEELGYKVLTAGTPDEAIRLAGEHAGDIHLLFTDVVMPKMNGWDLANALSSPYPGLKVLYTSGYTENVIAHRGVLDEGVNFISKPFSRKKLGAKVREVLDRKQTTS